MSILGELSFPDPYNCGWIDFVDKLLHLNHNEHQC